MNIDGASAEPGDGVTAENFLLNAQLTLSGGGNTNLFYQDVEQDRDFAASLLVTPSISIETLKASNLGLKVNWEASWQQYLDSQDNVLEQSGFATKLGAAAHINQKGAASVRLEEGLTRTNEAPNAPSAPTIHRVINRAGAVVGVHPGGRVLQGYFSYHWETTNYNQFLEGLDKDEHDFQLRGVYKFLPRTAALLTTNFRLIDYDESGRVAGGRDPPKQQQYAAAYHRWYDRFDHEQPLGARHRRLGLELLRGWTDLQRVAGGSRRGLLYRLVDRFLDHGGLRALVLGLDAG